MKNNEKGVTLIILVITIIVMIIIAGITVYNGMESIQMASLQDLKTNMLLIEAKTKQYVEEVSFKMGTNPDEEKIGDIREEVYVTNGKLTKLSDASGDVNKAASDIGITANEVCYYVSIDALNSMGLNQVKEGNGAYYLVVFNEEDISVEIYNTKGYNDNGIIKYTLTEIDEI